MKKLLGVLLLPVTLLTVFGSLKYGEVDKNPVQPQEGNATITFYRDGLNLAETAGASVPILLEKENHTFEPVGIINPGYKIRKELPPGQYSFFTGLVRPTRLNTTLEANKHYYVRLDSPFKLSNNFWNPRFEFVPLTGEKLEKNIPRIKHCQLIKFNDAANQWFIEHEQDLKTRLMDSYHLYSEEGSFKGQLMPAIDSKDGIDELF